VVLHPNPLEEIVLDLCRFPDAKDVTCAVSGGADSIALLLLALAAGKNVTAIHVDHGIREGSRAEAELVEQIATKFGASFVAKSVVVEPGPNLEARARAARYGVLPDDVLTGHTADDQAETVLLNLMRGAGLSGLAGMRMENKPILGLRRKETEAICEMRDITPFADPSNSDPSFRRYRVRNELIPLLDDIADRDVAEIIARQTPVLRDDDDLLNALVRKLDPTDAKALTSAPRALARRAVRLWLEDHLDDEKHPPSSASIERVLGVARGEATGTEIEGGIAIRRSHQRLSIESLQGYEQ
jgi:tRNA(Ile)-lysidine synthase